VSAGPTTLHRLDRVRTLVWIVPAAWFAMISAIRLSVLIATIPIGYDGMLYRDATLRWLAGGDPWARTPDFAALYAAPPPTLIAMLPFAALPELVARAGLVALGLVASIWLIRRLRLPVWWLLFPPLVDGIYIANPHVFVVPLLVAGWGPLAVLVKAYAGAVPAFLAQWRVLVMTAAIVLVTAPVLPWRQFIERWPEISAALASQSGGGGLSVQATPVLLPVAVIAAVLLGRKRLAWWAVPTFWPYTQWYYSSMVLPVATPLAAMALAAPVPGATTVAIAVAVVEIAVARRLAGVPVVPALAVWRPRTGSGDDLPEPARA
jgi:hypothetical protein